MSSGPSARLILLLVVVAACATEPAVTTPTSEGSRIVVLDTEGNIATMDSDGSKRRMITDDAGPDVRYFQPVWSPDGAALAWGEARTTGFRVSVADDGGTVESVDVPNFPFYLYWSPDGAQIGALHNAPDGNGLHFRLIDVDQSETDLLDVGAPYYFSWSPDGSELAVHVGGDRIAIISSSGESSDLGATTPNYLAPDWTDAGIFYATDQGVVLRPDQGNPRIVVETGGRFVSFAANHDGSRLAIQLPGAAPSLPVALAGAPTVAGGVIAVLDVATEELETVARGTALGLFWSPDGAQLLMLIPTNGERVFDIAVWESGETNVVSSLRLPTSLVRDALVFADQYAQSWRVWAPDSAAFALPGELEGRSGIWVFSVEGSEPEMVDEGEWVAWSP